MTLLLNITDFLIILRYYDTFLGERRRSSGLFFGLHSAVIIFLGIFINSFGNPLYNVLVTFTILFLTSIFYSEKWIMKLCFCFAYLGIGAVSEIIVLSLVGDKYRGDNELLSYLLIIISQLMKYLLFLLISKFKKVKNENLQKETIILIVLILFSGAFASLAINWFPIYEKDGADIVVTLIMVIILMIIFILMFILIDKFNVMTRLNCEQSMIIQERSLKESYYKDIDAYNHQLSKIKHDFKNQLTPLLDLTENDLVSARETIKNMFHEISNIENTVYTSNNALNAICKVKFSYAMSKNILLEYKIDLPKHINITYGDMGILYGNLFDNAIESCEKVKSELRIIIMNTQLYNDNLLISMENSKLDSGLTDKKFRTTKKDKKNHGFGIKSVKEIVDKYNGKLEISEDKELFKVNIVLYGIEKIEK